MYGLDEGTGLWAFVVAASETPLPGYRQWLRERLSGRTDWNRVGSPPTGNVWWDDGFAAVKRWSVGGPMIAARGGVAGKQDELGEVGSALTRLTDRFRARGQVQAASAFAFCVVPRIKP